MNKQALRAMTTARSVLIMDHPFFGCLVLQLKLVEASFIDTMAVDGKHLFYNPEFTLAQTEEHRIGIIAHEAYHCAYRHHTRMGGRTLDRWNRACDYVINPDLRKVGFKLPDWVLYDEQYFGLSSEEVYVRLPEPPKQPEPQKGKGGGGGKPDKGKGDGQSSGGQKADNDDKGQGGQSGQQPGEGGTFEAPDPGRMGGVIPHAPAWDQAANSAEDARWEAITRQAVNVAKAQNAGKVPGFLERLVSNLEKPRIEWDAVLRRYVDNSVSKDYSWMRPNRRLISSGLIMPGMVSDKINHIVGVMDTSGSVTDKLVGRYAAEKTSLLDEGYCDKLTVIYADVKVQGVQEFQRGDEVVLNPKGGGGTNFRAVMEYIKTNCDDASLVLFFTDLHVTQFGEEPPCPVLWVTYGDSRTYKHLAAKVPFGDTMFASEA